MSDNTTPQQQMLSVVDLVGDEDEESVPEFAMPQDNEDVRDGDGDDDDDDDDLIFVGVLQDRSGRHIRHPVTSALPNTHRATNYASTKAGFEVRPGDDFELEDEYFVRVVHIIEAYLTGETLIEGIKFRRTHALGGIFPKKRNELCAVIEAPAHVEDPAIDTFLATIPLDSLGSPRQIVLTNLPFLDVTLGSPRTGIDHSYRDHIGSRYQHLNRTEERVRVREEEILACRWKLIKYIDPTGKLLQKGRIQHLSEKETDPGKSMPDVVKTFLWRGENATKAEIDQDDDAKPHPKRKRRDSVIDLVSDEEIVVPKERRTKRHISKESRTTNDRSTVVRHSNTIETYMLVQKSGTGRSSSSTAGNPRKSLYTYGELCVGAGGVLQVAVRKFKVKYVLDHWDAACKTVRRNCPELKVLHDDIHGFCTKEEYLLLGLVALMHISFPCQNDSPANTLQERSKNFNAIEATKYSVMDILKRAKPRVVTMEQTSGMLTHHPVNFRAMVHQFASMNYSFSWEIKLADDYGGPQKRRRLIMLSSCPGEPLPSMPEPTHGDPGSGLKPRVSIQDCLDQVHERVEPHMLNYGQETRIYRPHDPHQPLKTLIDTSGGKGTHPDGWRPYTMQELAMLQCFHPDWKFVPAGLGVLRTLIGNAVPSGMANAWFREAEKSMRERDKDLIAYKPEVIELD